MTGEAFRLHKEVERLRAAIEEHRDARSTSVSGDTYYADNVYDQRLWSALDG